MISFIIKAMLLNEVHISLVLAFIHVNHKLRTKLVETICEKIREAHVCSFFENLESRGKFWIQIS